MDKLTQAERNAALSLKRKKATERRKKLWAANERRLKAQKEANRKWRAANPDKVAAYQARYYAKKVAENAAFVAKLPILAPEVEPDTQPDIPTPEPAPYVPFDPAKFYPPDFLAKLKEQNADEGAPKPPDVVDNG